MDRSPTTTVGQEVREWGIMIDKIDTPLDQEKWGARRPGRRVRGGAFSRDGPLRSVPWTPSLKTGVYNNKALRAR